MMEGMRWRAAEGEPAALPGGGARERCPRCLSRDTKFCYYNNYNTTQPRHFCKSCRPYWTLGGTLRNVPIGGSSRKRLRRTSPSAAAAASSSSVASVKPLRSLPSLINQADLGFGYLLSSAGFRALGEPLLQGRTGFELGLRLGLGVGTGASTSMEEMGFGTSLLWPSTLLEDEIGCGRGGNTWRIGSGTGEGCFGGTDWKDVGVSAPRGGSGGGPDQFLK